MFDVEAVQVGAGTKVEVGSSGSGPPEPQGLFGSAGRFGEEFDLDADDGALDDGERFVVGPVAAAVEAGGGLLPSAAGGGAGEEGGGGGGVSLLFFHHLRCRGRVSCCDSVSAPQ